MHIGTPPNSARRTFTPYTSVYLSPKTLNSLCPSRPVAPFTPAWPQPLCANAASCVSCPRPQASTAGQGVGQIRLACNALSTSTLAGQYTEATALAFYCQRSNRPSLVTPGRAAASFPDAPASVSPALPCPLSSPPTRFCWLRCPRPPPSPPPSPMTWPPPQPPPPTTVDRSKGMPAPTAPCPT